MATKWSVMQARTQVQRYLHEQPQLTNFDSAQYPGQRYVDRPTDGRGGNPTSYATYPDMIMSVPQGMSSSTGTNARMTISTGYQPNTVQPSFGKTTQLAKLTSMVLDKCKLRSGT